MYIYIYIYVTSGDIYTRSYIYIYDLGCHHLKEVQGHRSSGPCLPCRASYAWILLGPTCGAPTVMFLAIDVMNPADAGPDGEAKWGVPRPRHWPSRTGIASEPHKRNHKIYIIVGRSTKPELAPRAVPPAHATKLRPEPDVVHTSMPEPTTSVLGAHLPSMGDTHCYPTPTSIPTTPPPPGGCQAGAPPCIYIYI